MLYGSESCIFYYIFFPKFVILVCQRHYFPFFFYFNLADEPYKKPPKCLGSQDIREGYFKLINCFFYAEKISILKVHKIENIFSGSAQLVQYIALGKLYTGKFEEKKIKPDSWLKKSIKDFFICPFRVVYLSALMFCVGMLFYFKSL